MRKNTKKKGFTLVELVIVLVILSVISAIAVPFFMNYWKKAEFQKNEANAKTVYLAAESRLTYYRNSGQWEDFKKEILAEGMPYTDASQVTAEVTDEEGNGLQTVAQTSGTDLKGRIYAITLGAKSQSDSQNADNPVLELLEDYIYDTGFFDGSIAIEIDVESGEVYSAFYGTKCKGLNYEEQDADGYLTMQDRGYESRSKRLLGYYSTEDTVNVVSLKPKKLRITTINLLNSEQLSLNWSSNVGGSRDVSYEIKFYNKDSNELLFSLTMSPYDMVAMDGWSGTAGGTSTLAKFTLKDSTGKDRGVWAFPVNYSDNKYSLVLDAMMSAEVQAMINISPEENIAKARQQLYSTNITRLNAVSDELAQPVNMYATVKAVSYAGNKGLVISQEYRPSEEVASNVANSMFGDKSDRSSHKMEIETFRHLSNIRYYKEETSTEETTFELASRKMDWASVGTGLYAIKENGTGGAKEEKLYWIENTAEQTVNFPTIALLGKKQTLQGKGNKTPIVNLSLGETSILDDTMAAKITNNRGFLPEADGKYLGLFAQIAGNVKNVTFQDATIELGIDKSSTHKFSRLLGVGILAGRSKGNLEEVAVTTSKAMKQKLKDEKDFATVHVSLKNAGAANDADGAEKIAAVGGIVGVIAGGPEKSNSSTTPVKELELLVGVTLDKLTSEGRVIAELPDTEGVPTDQKTSSSTEKTAADYCYGIGGIAGYAWIASTNPSGTEGMVHFGECKNHAEVRGNLLTGGIAGTLRGNQKPTTNIVNYQEHANILNCSNDGLILCTTKKDDMKVNSLLGYYFGGIVGYGKDMIFYNATSASGRASDFTYAESKIGLLLGNYVGGIVGYGEDSVINSCSTEKDGYVLGADYVGGIAGGLDGSVQDSIRADNAAVSVTTNANYVIGMNYVGGITGKNSNKVKLQNCVNNGVVAGYEKYIGGIVGYNTKEAEIYDCASYLSDYDGSVFNMIVKTWNATGDYVGGVAGYNNGKITFTKDSQKITVKSVNSIVVGNNYIGGVVGFNDVDGELEVHYTLIGGKIYAYEDCAGGMFGLNASEKVLTKDLVIKPQSVHGRYYVGGCIGANVVDLSADTDMSGFRADNILGSISGEAFCGGIIGYQRTYTAAQLGVTTGDPVCKKIDALRTTTDASEKLFPTVKDASGVPTAAVASENKYTLTVRTKGNDANLTTDTNNIPISTNLYAGGIVGYCERESGLVLKDCKNSGDITKLSAENTGVSLKAYIHSSEVGTTTASIDDQIKLHFVGGITGVNLEKEVIDHCANTGSVSGFSGIGGVVSLNTGLVYHCALNENFGNAALNYIGGIVGINIGTSTTTTATLDYGKIKNYKPGTIQSCSTAGGKTIAGQSNVGGIAGWNATGGTLKDNISQANIQGSGNYIGGLVGRNSGSIEAGVDSGTASRNIEGKSGEGVGGLVGINEASGTIKVVGTGGTTTTRELIAVNDNVTVWGKEKVGGIIGINKGQIGEANGTYLTCQAKSVRATNGLVGGIAGTTDGNIRYARNQSASVSADAGYAGGIVAENNEGHTIANCENYGNVNSSNGYAGGISSINYGTITACKVVGTTTAQVTISSRGTDEIGAITAINETTGVISDSAPETYVNLDGQATVFGGVTGVNRGSIKPSSDKVDYTISYMPQISSAKKQLTVGGAAGLNEGTIEKVRVTLNFEKFNTYQYLGGIAGQNGAQTKAASSAKITECAYSGTITETGGAAGNCYGGITGINYAKLENCTIPQINMNIQGVYTATSTSTAEQKEQLASHAGGIAGKNETNGVITGCLLTDTDKSKLSAEYGMLGGVTGFNKGTINLSGSDKTANIMKDLTDAASRKEISVAKLNEKATAAGLKADITWINYNASNGAYTAATYRDKKKIETGRLKLLMNTNGNLGGITAYNGTNGSIEKCVSGNWLLNNKSEAIGVGTGGIIGMNESEKNLRFVVNGAFVRRQLQSGVTNRFAGGIIGNQNNTTTSDWEIDHCINYGTIYCYNTHYSGGIIGQWTGSGGTIRSCLNYGVLQTTYQAGWIGASGGIVAQLYHAYENQEYNLISCGNYGSIYTKEGEKYDRESGANDSAGILGNVTTYKVSNENDSQNFTIQILDCFNAPGVKIYSASMASGIFGFLSCDDPGNGSLINNSTKNVKIRIERCRNYAYFLGGANYATGIFGDRYHTGGWKNTVVKDCYSLSRSEYSDNGNYPIYSAGAGKGNSENMDPANRTDNYYWDAKNTDAFTNIKLYQGTGQTGSGSVSDNQGTAGLNNRYAYRSYFMYDATVGKYFVAQVNPGTGGWWGSKTINGSQAYINENGDIVNKDGTIQGRVLYYIGTTPYNKTLINNDTNLKNQNVDIFVNARNTWVNTEGINTAGTVKTILAPASAAATIKDGKVEITVTPQKNGKDQNYDPFAYEVMLTDKDGHSASHMLYTEEGSFTIPSGLSGDLTIQVRSVSMYEDVKESELVKANTQNLDRVLPAPDIRVDLVSDTSWGNNEYLAYRFTLTNVTDYTDYADWQVTVKIPGEGTVTLNKDELSANIRLKTNTTNYQMIAQASSTNNTAQSSQEVSTSVGLPHYGAPIALKGTTSNATVTTKVEGTTIDDLAINVTINSGQTAMQVPPVYRVELIGDWTGADRQEHTNVVLKQTDVLLVSKGAAIATLTGFPEYLSTAENMRIRIWYAASGLGPVYTYYPVSATDTANGKVTELTGVDENGNGQWSYYHSTVLENYGNTLTNYSNTYSNNIISWLQAPVLKDAGTTLVPVIDSATGSLSYTFKWDENVTGTNAQYEVSLTGIDDAGREVVIDVSDAYKTNTAKSLTIDGTDWNYKQVTLKVTRLGGTTSGNTTQIGLSATGTYTVKPRLSQPAQPTITNPDVNELNYVLSWASIPSEDGCVGYQAYVRAYENNTLGAATAVGEQIALDKKDPTTGLYSETVNLEAYAGKRVVIYLVAEADPNGAYINSAAGVTYELQIPKRLTKPNVTWTTNWTYDKKDPTTADSFLSGALRVSLKAADNGSIPPGGSAYLLKAYVYNTKAEAEAATDTNPGSAIAYYPPGSIPENGDIASVNVQPVQMGMTNSTDYYHDISGLSIRYAGKYVVFYARISSGSGNVSSAWVRSAQAYQLPYVKLATPEVGSAGRPESVEVTVSNTPHVPGIVQTWSMEHTTLAWDAVESADLYNITLNGKVKDENNTTVTTNIAASVQIEMNTDGTPAVKEKGDSDQNWTAVNLTNDGTNAWKGTLTKYAVTISSNYVMKDGVTTGYYENLKLSAQIEITKKDDGTFHYEIILPDAKDVTDGEGASVTHENFNVTQKATVSADVQANQAGTGSEAFVGSEAKEINWNN